MHLDGPSAGQEGGVSLEPPNPVWSGPWRRDSVLTGCLPGAAQTVCYVLLWLLGVSSDWLEQQVQFRVLEPVGDWLLATRNWANQKQVKAGLPKKVMDEGVVRSRDYCVCTVTAETLKY